MKDCGFALDEIGQLLQRHDTPAIEAMLRQRMVAQEQHVAEEQARLQRMVARLQQLCASDATAMYDVALKRSEPMTLIGKRQYVASTDEISPSIRTTVHQLLQAGTESNGPMILLYFDDDDACGDQLDMFAGVPVTALPSQMDELECQRLPGDERLACVIYRGDYPGIGAAYRALDHWVAASGYCANGPYREIYLRSPADSNDTASYLTEIQLPIIVAEKIR